MLQHISDPCFLRKINSRSSRFLEKVHEKVDFQVHVCTIPSVMLKGQISWCVSNYVFAFRILWER